MILLQLNPMSRTVAISEILILLAAAAFVGWLLARLILSGRIKNLREDIADRRAELAECRASTHQEVVPVPVPAAIAAPAPAIAVPPPVVNAFIVETDTAIESAADDLKVIEGVGPKIEELLNADGIRTFARLASSDPKHLSRLLSAAGARFQIHDPASWPQQAALARDGHWEELATVQERLLGGRA